MYLGKLILELANIRLETIGGPHFNKEEVMIVLFELLTVRVLSEKQLSEISEPVDCALRKEVESVGGHPFKLEGKSQHKMESFLKWITILS